MSRSSLAEPGGSAPRTYGGFREWAGDGWTVLRCARRLHAIYARERIDAVLREQIMLAVSRANSCRRCVNFHETHAARQGGEAGPADADAVAGARLDSAVAYAVARAEAGRGLDPDSAVERAFRKHFDAWERSDIEAVISLITFANLTANSLRSLSERAAMRRVGKKPGRRFSSSRGGP